MLDIKVGIAAKQTLLLQLKCPPAPPHFPSSIALLRLPLLNPQPFRGLSPVGRRCEGAADRQLGVVAEAEAGQFVGTKRLEEEVGGEAWRTWRNILAGYCRYPYRVILPIPGS